MSQNIPNESYSNPFLDPNTIISKIKIKRVPNPSGQSTPSYQDQNQKLVLDALGKADEALKKSSSITGTYHSSKLQNNLNPFQTNSNALNALLNTETSEKGSSKADKSFGGIETPTNATAEHKREFSFLVEKKYSPTKYSQEDHQFLAKVDDIIKRSVQTSAGFATFREEPVHITNHVNNDYIRVEEFLRKKGLGQSPQAQPYIEAHSELPVVFESYNQYESVSKYDSKPKNYLGVSDPTNLSSSYVLEKMPKSPRKDIGERISVNNREEKNAPAPIPILQEVIRPKKYVDEYYDDGSIYRGEKLKNVKVGRGTFQFVDGKIYDGEWENDRRTGYGILKLPNGEIIYDGEWKDDEFHGNGTLSNSSISEDRNFSYSNFDTLGNGWLKYEGEFNNGKMNGMGTLFILGGQKFVGKFRYDKIHGSGTYHNRDGTTVFGEWEDNKFVKRL